MAELVCVVEPDEALRRALCAELERQGFDCLAAGDGVAGLDAFRRHAPALVILDLQLPGMDGLALCRAIREESAVPVVILSARDAEADKVTGLEAGADDYVTKPFSMRELVTRVRARLRRAGASGEPASERILAAGPVHMDLQRHEVHVRGRLVDLTPKEFALLEALLVRQGKLATRRVLIAEVWGAEYVGDTRTLDVHVRRLRSKIEEDSRHPRHLRTVRGLGYKFQP